MKRIFRDNSLEKISSQNRASLHESMLNTKPELNGATNGFKGAVGGGNAPEEIHESQKTPKPRRSGPLRGLRDKFAKQSLDDISKEAREDLHESMIPKEIELSDRRQEKYEDHPEHTELHESQKVNTMRKKKPKNVRILSL
mgnify:CR=1 FL=1